MRIVTIASLAIFAVAKICAEDLPAPSDVNVALFSPKTVKIGWKWPDSTKNKIDEVRFVVTVTPGKTLKIDNSSIIEVNDLKPSTNYTFEVHAELIKSPETKSEAVNKSFVTLEKDYPKPEQIINDKKEAKNNSITYTTSWQLDKSNSLSGLVTEYSILFTSKDSKTEKTQLKNPQVETELAFDTSYGVTVSAVFSLPMGLNRTTQSDLSKFTTEAGKPGKVENLKIEQTEDTVDLKVEWAPPREPRGKIVEYNVQVLQKGNITVEKSTEGTSADISLPLVSPLAEVYTVQVQAVNNADEKTRNGDFVQLDWTLKKPQPPQMALNGRTNTSLTVRFEKATKNPDIFFRMKYAGNKTQDVKLNVNPILTGFEAYQTVEIEVSSCLKIDEKSSFCGNASSFKETTNVGPPSKVSSLTAVYNGNKPKVNWQKPETPRGPIDGYYLTLRNKTTTISQLKIDSKLEYIFEPVGNCIEYEISVTPFNKDLDDNKKEVLGDVTSTKLPGSCGSAGFPVWAIVLIVVLILGGAGAGAYYYFKMR